MNAVEMIDFNQIENQNRLKNVCAYARVSTTKELQETSLELQIETYTKMIKENPEWKFVGVYSDVGKSGTAIKHRDQFNQMIELAVAGGIDLIITKSISRFARNTIDCLNIIQELKRHNIEVWFEKENISSFDPKVELTITIYASVAEEESKINSENTKWGVKKRFQDGIVPMVTSRVLGYKRNKDGEIEIDEDEAKIVRKVFNMYSKGYSQGYIAEELNKDGLLTKYYNLPYQEGTIRGLLNNEKYTGNALLQKSIRRRVGDRTGEKNQQTQPKYYVENSHPKIITKALWDRVHSIKSQRMLKYNHTNDVLELKRKAKSRSIYSGFIECPICGKNYHYKVNNKREKWATEILICSSNREKKVCENDSLFVETFDEQMISQINYVIKNKYEFLRTLNKVLSSHPEIKFLNKEIISLEKKLTEIHKQIRAIAALDGEFESLVLNELKAQKSETETSLTANRNKLLTSHNIESKIKHYKLLLKTFKHPIEELSEFPFKEFFEKVVVNDRNDIEMVLNPFKTEKNIVIYSFPEIITPYRIRKTLFETTSKITCK